MKIKIKITRSPFIADFAKGSIWDIECTNADLLSPKVAHDLGDNASAQGVVTVVTSDVVYIRLIPRSIHELLTLGYCERVYYPKAFTEVEDMATIYDYSGSRLLYKPHRLQYRFSKKGSLSKTMLLRIYLFLLKPLRFAFYTGLLMAIIYVIYKAMTL